MISNAKKHKRIKYMLLIIAYYIPIIHDMPQN